MAATVNDGDVFRAQKFGLHGSIDRRHAAADDHHIAADGQGGLVTCLAQLSNEINGVADVLHILTRRPQGVHATKTHAQKHGIMGLLHIGQSQIAAQSLAGFNADAADLQKPIHLTRGKVIGRFVARDPVFVQATRLRTGVINHHIMALHRQTVCTGQTRRPCPHHGHGFARRLGALEGMHTLGHHRVGGKALQAADFHRLALGCLTHAGLFAQLFCRANAGAHAAQNVLIKDRLGRRLGRAGGDLADEQGNVDGRRAGRHAGRIVAEIAAICRHPGLVPVKRGFVIREVGLIGALGQTRGDNAVGQRAVGQGGTSHWLCFSKIRLP